jgi:hypothetical protein
MNGQPTDAPTKALEFFKDASVYALVADIALLAWVSSGVEFTNESLRLTAMACLTLSAIFGIGTLALIPLVQESRRPGQSNFEVDARFNLFGPRAYRLKTLAFPQHLLLLIGIVLYVVGMIE